MTVEQTPNTPLRLCHLGPETPALSMTFVYREAIALKKRGHEVTVASVRRPKNPATDVGATLGDVFTLYDASFMTFLAACLKAFFKRPLRFCAVTGMAVGDLAASAVEKRFSPALLWHWFVAFHFAQFLEARRVQHVHVHFAHFPTQIAMYAARFAGLPFTVMAHANDIYENGVLLAEKASRAEAFVSISDYNRQYLSSLGVALKKMPIVRCGVSLTDDLESSDAGPGSSGDFVVGSLGRLVPKKGMDTTIRAVGALKAEGVPVKLEIVGDGPLREELETLVADLGLGSEISFKGAMPNSAVMAWMDRLDLFVLACRRDQNGDVDGIPVALMEAMAKGKPVISTKISGVPELIVDGSAGLLVEPEDHDALATALRHCVEDEGLYNRLSNGARQRIEEEFGEKVNTDRLESIMRDAVRKNTP